MNRYLCPAGHIITKDSFDSHRCSACRRNAMRRRFAADMTMVIKDQIVVDRLRIWKGRRLSAHMASRSLVNLRRFASVIRCRAYHATPYPHFDISAPAFERAMQAGAMIVDNRVLLRIAKECR